MKYVYSYEFPVGRYYIAEADGAITDISTYTVEGAQTKETPLISKAAEQIREYFNGRRKAFDLPLNAVGTGFRKRVWDAMLEIPYGETKTYKDMAELAGNVKACRAAGGACGANPISIVIPCHRVIGSDDSLTGYGGGLHIKTALLELEQRYRTLV